MFAAIALIATAIAITWFAPTNKTPSLTCLYTHGQLVARLNAETLAMDATGTGTTIKPCR